jgi:xanthine dehydrogenase accessory factor
MNVRVDPVCGMTVAIAAVVEIAAWSGTSCYFCGPGCRSRFERDPGRCFAVQL